MERCAHASTIISTIINGVSTSPTLVVIGGVDSNEQRINDCLLFDNITTSQFSHKKVRVHAVL